MNISSFSLAVLSFKFVSCASGHLLVCLLNKWTELCFMCKIIFCSGCCVCVRMCTVPVQKTPVLSSWPVEERECRYFKSILSRGLQLGWGTQRCGSILIYGSVGEECQTCVFNTQIRFLQSELQGSVPLFGHSRSVKYNLKNMVKEKKKYKDS